MKIEGFEKTEGAKEGEEEDPATDTGLPVPGFISIAKDPEMGHLHALPVLIRIEVCPEEESIDEAIYEDTEDHQCQVFLHLWKVAGPGDRMFRPREEDEEDLEDWVRYVIYLPDGADIQQIKDEIMELAVQMSAGYLWDKDAFSLRQGSNPRTGTLLYGHQRLGEQQEDEWMVTRILLQASYLHPKLVISLEDQDGIFLLIEAADVIPEWLEPETSANRVFICAGALCIIPPDAMPKTPRLKDAVETLRSDPGKFRASTDVLLAIRERLKDLDNPAALLHRAKATLPIRASAIFKADPNLVSAAMYAFCERIDKRAPRLAGWEGEAVTTLLTLTKAHFAKLAFQPSCVPEGYPMPDSSSPEYIRHDLGLKLTLGLDILARKFDYQEHFSALLAGMDMNDPEACTISGQEDNTKWMDVDPGQLDDHMASAEEQFKLNEQETEELMKQWDQEYEKPGKGEEDQLKSSVDRLKGFLESMKLKEFDDESDHDGSSNEEDFSDSNGDCSDDDAREEDDSDFLEFEILETLRHDPDLLMRIIEMNAHAGVDSAPLMAQLNKLAGEDEKKIGSRQKGLADIDPVKLEEARMPPYRKLPDFVDKENEKQTTEAGEHFDDEETEDDERPLSPLSSSDDEADVAAHTPTFQEFVSSHKQEVIIDDDEATLEEYYAQMDSELASKLNA